MVPFDTFYSIIVVFFRINGNVCIRRSGWSHCVRNIFLDYTIVLFEEGGMTVFIVTLYLFSGKLGHSHYCSIVGPIISMR